MVVRIFTLFFLSVLLIPRSFVKAQQETDQRMIMQLQTDISYLASDELEGRRTATKGELMAAEYIIKRYKEIGISPYKNEYLYPFHFVYGKEIAPATTISINNTLMRINDDAFPLPFSPNKHISSDVIPEVNEQGNTWIVPLFKDKEQANDAHFECEKYM